jgi:hypothetical protein
MSLARIAQFVIGLILAVAGLVAIITCINALPGAWIQAVIGLGALAVGVYIMMGGSFTI